MTLPGETSEASGRPFDPLVPRPIDRPTILALAGDIDDALADRAKIFAAPDAPADWPVWRSQLERWRDGARARIGPVENATATDWASRCLSVAIVWLWDERLFDHGEQRFDVDRFVDVTATEFGGFDGVVLWHAYPIIGIDERNQFDFYRDVPGLTGVVSSFQRRGVRVFVDYNPWDTGTRREPTSDAVALRAVVGDLGADGVFLDTMSDGGSELVGALHDLVPTPALESESRVPLTRLVDHPLSWAQWFADSDAPGVIAARWFAPSHLLHHTRRWNRDHSAELQSSWMNGTGMIVWDAVFGSWVGWNERDRSTLRAMMRARRALDVVFRHGDWTPLVDAPPGTEMAGVYVSRFETVEATLWTVVNRADHDVVTPVLGPQVSGDGSWFEVCSGTQMDGPGSPIEVPARGVAGVLRLTGAVPATVIDLLTAARNDMHAPDAWFPARTARRVRPEPSRSAAPPVDAIELAPGERDIDVDFRVRETGLYDGAPFVEEWKPLPPRLHAAARTTRRVTIGRVAVAPCEVVDAAGQPITGVTLDEARERARRLGARLPTEFEWQVATADRRFRRAEPLVWNWTESEHSDGVTRFAILKGGCDHVAIGSEWYFDGGARAPEFSAKLLLAGLGGDRSPSIGFRLAWDLDAGDIP